MIFHIYIKMNLANSFIYFWTFSANTPISILKSQKVVIGYISIVKNLRVLWSKIYI